MKIKVGSGVAMAYDIGSEKSGAFGTKSTNYELLYLFASAAINGDPNMQFKRASKVEVVKGDGWFDEWNESRDYEAQLKAKNLHGLRRHFTNM